MAVVVPELDDVWLVPKLLLNQNQFQKPTPWVTLLNTFSLLPLLALGMSIVTRYRRSYHGLQCKRVPITIPTG